MKLYLSSYQFGNWSQEFVRQVGGPGARVAFITNAGDQWPEVRAAKVADELQSIIGLGLEAHELDLRNFFADADGWLSELCSYQGVWVRGGNTFILRRAMLASGFDDVARPLIENNSLAYGGYSAGVCAITPTLRGLEVVDFPNEVPDGYATDIPWDGMGLVDYAVAPHYQSDHEESELMNEVVALWKRESIRFRTLRDGEVIIVDDDHERCIS